MRLSGRAKRIPPFYVMDILERAFEMEVKGREIFHLEVGEPDFPTPPPVNKRAYRAMEEGFTHYTHSLGIRELRETISEYYSKRYRVDISPSNIVISSGSSPLLFMVFSALLDPGDEVIITDPSYPCYANVVEFIGGIVRRIPIRREDNFQLDVDRVKKLIGKRTKAIVLASPSNPTGVTVDDRVFEELSSIGVTIISDEIYHGLVYEGSERSVLEFTDNAVVINGFSKRFAMTGWRLGYMIAPEDLVGAIQRIHQNILISAGSFVQWGGVAALKDCLSYAEDMKKSFDERRKLTLSLLEDEGINVGYRPVGAFYVYLDLGDYIDDSYQFSLSLLNEKGVAVTPGIDFGPSGKKFIRISYATSKDNIEKGIKLLADYLRSFRG